MPSVFANDRSILHQGDHLTQTAAAPDVCKTPSPGGPMPVPYPNFAPDALLVGGSRTVMIEGFPVAHAKASLAPSTGDEPGTAGGGIVSNIIKGKMTWLTCSMDVTIEGNGVARFLDPTMHNGNTSNTTGTSQGAPGVPAPPPPPKQCPPHDWEELPPKHPTLDEKIKALERSGSTGDHYTACLARKFKAANRSVDVSIHYKCRRNCGQDDAYGEVDIMLDGAPCECKAGSKGAKKNQTLKIIEISNQLIGGAPVTLLFGSAATAAREKPHVEKWGAQSRHEPC